jgi:hypothetical protein
VIQMYVLHYNLECTVLWRNKPTQLTRLYSHLPLTLAKHVEDGRCSYVCNKLCMLCMTACGQLKKKKKTQIWMYEINISEMGWSRGGRGSISFRVLTKTNCSIYARTEAWASLGDLGYDCAKNAYL